MSSQDYTMLWGLLIHMMAIREIQSIGKNRPVPWNPLEKSSTVYEYQNEKIQQNWAIHYIGPFSSSYSFGWSITDFPVGLLFYIPWVPEVFQHISSALSFDPTYLIMPWKMLLCTLPMVNSKEYNVMFKLKIFW